MACNYTYNGKFNRPLTDVLQYLEDIEPQQRNGQDIIKLLQNSGVLDPGGVTFPESELETLEMLNSGISKFFGVTYLLQAKSEYGKYVMSVDENSLRRAEMPSNGSTYSNQSYKSPLQNKIERSLVDPIESTEQEETQNDPDEKQSEKNNLDEVFGRKNNKDILTKQIIENLQLQIERLNRMQETEATEKRRIEIEVIRKKLEKVVNKSEILNDYFDFVTYVMNLSNRAEAKLKKIERHYGENWKNISQKERAEILKDLSDLKETIDAFYNDDQDRSITTKLLNKINSLEGDERAKDQVIIMLGDTISKMKAANDKYLELGIPIQVDYLMSFAPIEVNEQLDRRIEYIKKERRLSGFYWREPDLVKRVRANKAMGISRMDTLLQINIEQLEKLKIGRQAIIDELKETHKDISAVSAYTDPIIYNSQAAIQMFASAVKEKMLEASDKTIDFKYDLEVEYNMFLKASEHNETNPEKLYENMYEVVEYYSLSKDFDYKTGERKIDVTKVLQLVNPDFDVAEYNKRMNEAWKKIRKDYNFPAHAIHGIGNGTEILNEYFKSSYGKGYIKAQNEWYSANTEVIPGAQDEIKKMQTELNSLLQDISKASEEGNNNAMIALQIEYNALKAELNSVYKNGVIRGKFVQPKKSIYGSKNYEKMTPAQKRYHGVLLQYSAESQKKLGKNAMRKNSWEEFSYAVPTVRKSAIDRLQQKGYLNGALEPFKSASMILETDTEFGEAIKANGEELKVIPRYFTNHVDASEVSLNLTSNMIKFVDMANRYEAKSEITGVVSVMRSAVANRDVLELGSDGSPILTKASKKVGVNLPKRIKGKESNTYKQLEAFIDAFYYGKSNKESSKGILGTKISSNKLASSTATLMAASTLSFNFLQGVNQLVIDTTGNVQEGIAGQFFSYSDVWWARDVLHRQRYGLRSLKDSVGDTFNKTNKLTKALEKFDAFQELGGQFGQEGDGWFKKKIDMETIFVAQRTSEFINTSTRMLALARSYKGKLKDAQGKVLLNASGEEADLWDMLIEDSRGKLIVDPRVANFDSNKFSQIFHGLSRRANQLKGDYDATALEASWYGKLVTLFRRFMVPGIRKRFGHSNTAIHVDVELGQLTEGYYNAAVISIVNLLSDIKKGNYQKAIKKLNPKASPDFVRQETSKAVYEAVMRATLNILSIALAGIIADDDDEDSLFLNFVLYQTVRAKTELAAFSNYKEFWRITQNPTAANNLVKNIFELIGASIDQVGYYTGVVSEKDVFYQRRAGRFERGDSKWVKEFLDVFPVASGIFKTLDPKEATKYYDLTE